MLKNPAYAGAFVYGRTQSCHTRYASGKIISRRRPMAEWKIVVKDVILLISIGSVTSGSRPR
ncbi:recombinase family protein [Mesorhizobium sp. M0659]